MRNVVVFALGAAAGFAVGRQPRKFLKKVIQGGMQAGRRLKELQDEITEDLEDLTAEASEELEKSEGNGKVR